MAHEHHFAIVQDFAYAGLGVREQQISILSLPGAFDVAVEVCSLSKMYAMAGWRAGFIAGNDDIVGHVKQYHYQMGSMVTGMVQDAGAAALESDQSCVRELASRYAVRPRDRWPAACVTPVWTCSIPTVAFMLGSVRRKD